MKKNKVFVVLMLLMFSFVFLSGCSGDSNVDGQENPGTNKDALLVELIRGDGNVEEVDLTTLTSISGPGGFKKSTGTVVGPAEISGPRLMEVMDLVGGVSPGDAVEITAGDGYMMTFTYDQLQGEVMAYDTSGTALQVGGFEVILALESVESELIEAAPRVAFIGENICDGHYWIKDVAQIRVVPSVGEWELKLSGLREDVIDRSTFESLATCPDTPHPGQKWETTNKEGETEVYEGVPLWVVISMVDGNETEHFRFNSDLASEGYKIQVIAQDGYAVELDSMDVAFNDDIFLAYLKNGKPLGEDGPLTLAGPGLPTKQFMVKQLAEIKLIDLP